MKNIAVFFCAFAISSCASVSFEQIGQVNMISTRNVESKIEYVLLKSYAGGSQDELEESEANSVDQAIDNTVKSVPGGEFMKNVKLYIVIHVNGKKHTMNYAAQGDVWGIPISGENAIGYQGFKVGDKVTWKNPKKFKGKNDPSYITGVIISLKSETVLAKQDETDATGQDGETVELDYDEIAKIGQ